MISNSKKKILTDSEKEMIAQVVSYFVEKSEDGLSLDVLMDLLVIAEIESVKKHKGLILINQVFDEDASEKYYCEKLLETSIAITHGDLISFTLNDFMSKWIVREDGKYKRNKENTNEEYDLLSEKDIEILDDTWDKLLFYTGREI